MCARPAVFWDRDGTLIEDRGHLGSPSEVVFFPATVPALQRLARDFLFFIVTNQRGVADGVISLEQVDAVNQYVISRLAEAGLQITEVYVCPHRRTDGCQCIKPNPYFLHRAAQEYGLDLSKSFVVGDHPHDVELARRAGATGLYVRTGHGEKHLAELEPDTVVVADVMAAAQWIQGRTSGTAAGQQAY